MTLHWSFNPTCHLLMGGNTQEYDAARYPHTRVTVLVPTPGDSPQNPAREDRMLRAYLRKVVGWGGLRVQAGERPPGGPGVQGRRLERSRWQERDCHRLRHRELGGHNGQGLGERW